MYNNLIKHHSFVYTQLNDQAVLFLTIQFRISLLFKTLNNSIWPIDRTLSGATIPGQSGPRSDGNESVLRIPQSSSITRASPSDSLVSYLEHSLRRSYPSADMQSVYSTVTSDWAHIVCVENISCFVWEKESEWMQKWGKTACKIHTTD